MDPMKYVPKLSFGLLCQQDLNISIRLLKSGASVNIKDSLYVNDWDWEHQFNQACFYF